MTIAKVILFCLAWALLWAYAVANATPTAAPTPHADFPEVRCKLVTIDGAWPAYQKVCFVWRPDHLTGHGSWWPLCPTN